MSVMVCQHRQIDCFCNRLPELISKKLSILRISAFLLCERNCRIPLTKDQLYNNVSMQWRHHAALSVSLFITGTCFTFAGLLLADKFALSRNGYSSQLLRWIANTPLFIRIVPKCVITWSVVYVINYKLEKIVRKTTSRSRQTKNNNNSKNRSEYHSISFSLSI